MLVKDYVEYFIEPKQPDFEFDNTTVGAAVSAFENIWSSNSIEGISVALIGLNETRGSVVPVKNFDEADAVREKLFSLKKHSGKISIADFGNLKSGITLEDTYAAVSTICAELMRQQIIPILIGGSQDITFGQYYAYKKLAQIVNIANVDSTFDLGSPNDSLNSNSFLGQIILEQPNYLFNYSHIGHQIYFAGDDAVEKMQKLFFDTYRLGQIRENILEAEPILRNSDLLTFDMSAIRQSDAPATMHPSPNGFYAEEACQLMYYSGISEKISSIGLYEMDFSKDRDNQTAHLVAQMIWYFIEGLTKRKNELPAYNKNGYLKYTVALGKTDHEIIFLKSQKTDRWWMEIPILDNFTKFQRHHVIPCSYKDYQQALNDEMPERWWQAYQKLS